MALRNILTKEDETLYKKCRPVTEFNSRLHQLLDDMADTLEKSNGVGLAAPQVGVLRRIVVVECEPGVVYELINPVIIERDGTQLGREGCLSLPGQCGIVPRPMTVTVEATNRKGERFTVTGSGLLARAFCHELDHLDGILYPAVAQRMMTPEEIERLYNEENEDD
jgi:peptide deformylase